MLPQRKGSRKTTKGLEMGPVDEELSLLYQPKTWPYCLHVSSYMLETLPFRFCGVQALADS